MKAKDKEKIAMEVQNILHMNTGDGDSSYACNSFLQETAMWKTLPVLRHTIKFMANNDIIFNTQCFKVADLGCSSSINSLLVASTIIDMVHDLCEETKHKSPQFEVCLNDLFGNDFNTIFKMLPEFYSNLKKKKKKREHFGHCFVSATPGSFYRRLFPNKSLHLIHSMYALHWLSQVPEGIENNKSNIYMSKSSPPNVLEAYQKKFDTDFRKFLQMRSEELVQGGCMVLTFVGRSIADPTIDDCCIIWKLLAQSLHDILKEGLIQESDIKSFNMPYYNPCEDEVRNIIQNEGSFSLDMLNVFQVNWDPHDTDYISTKDFDVPSHIHGENAAKALRAVMEPLLTSHFGNSIIDILFDKFKKHVSLQLAKKKIRYYNIVVSLSRK
ncbi:S-adenosyl-L-methionine:benzoic acid/salicylic acid carboxyl methyltransferase 3 [Lactuca sativa]|uniref:Uncharacterized protein n=1 Tax=Lactuca sativa TaxID=4236 RepID=A0A9R1UWD4_LACSA|nr:S-adenosyl-L-methionine:benzoic acid/salicylic acid carboxyl methyltransferase 3 [Lactuca sativa]KAJ0195140.1 hypothetical protein LSAT_V11C700364230 [Lactuca sativa]